MRSGWPPHSESPRFDELVQPVDGDREAATGDAGSPESGSATGPSHHRLTAPPRALKEPAMIGSLGALTWADGPALILAGVSAVTTTTGARLLRGQDPMLMLALGIGVAGATFVLEKLLVTRFNALAPRQSLLSLLVCWLPLFLFATALATVATFSWIAPEVARRDLGHSRALHWTREGQKVSTYLTTLRSALRRQADASQLEVESERRRAAAARAAGESYAAEPLRAVQRRLSLTRDLERRVATVQPLPVERPLEPSEASQRLDRVFADLGDLHASALLVLQNAPPLPGYEAFEPPSGDLQTLLAEETVRGSWRATTAWGAALWVELLPLMALWRGGRKIPLAVRIHRWRRAASDTFTAIRGRGAAAQLPIVIEPLKVRGVVRLAVMAEYTLSDCAALLDEAVAGLSGVRGAYQLRGVSNIRGDALDANVPLLPQLRGEPLVLSVVEAGQ
jgi:hypothetical protein